MSAPGMKITNFHYGNLVFEKPVGFVEYPKWIHRTGQPSVIVQNAQEEADLAGGVQPLAPEPTPVEQPTKILTGSNDERSILIQIAKEKNIKIDARWKTDRIKATIERETAGLNG